MNSLIILGRQPSLGLAELESLYSANSIRAIEQTAALLNKQPTDIDFMRLGGMVKFCKVLTVLDTTDWREIQKFLEETAPTHATNLDEGKLSLGLSVYGIKTNPRQLMAAGLELKKLIKKSGRPVRFIPNKELALNSAQVLHNGLTKKLGWELVFVRDGGKTIVAQSIAVQDIERYAARDQMRPARDARVGMLPPKLAQTIINLARPKQDSTVLDPFCGTGVVLQEAMLMGYQAQGSDIDPRMVEYSQINLNWLTKEFQPKGTITSLVDADATVHTWPGPLDTIACETFLGRPLSSLPDRETMKKIVRDCDTIHTKFLKNVARQTNPNFRMCIAVPAWKTKNGFLHLPTLENLEKLGYNRVKFEFSSSKELIYHRKDQIVARELVVLERI